MFNKLVSNLSFNPGLMGQVGFYAKRLKKENALRRLSFVFIALAMVVQTFAVISPPQKSLAASSNHIFNGLSASNSAQTNINKIANAWSSTDLKDIYGYFGVTKSDIQKMSKSYTTIKSCDGNDWWTTGRNSLTGYSSVSQQYKNTQVAVNVGSGKTIYQRQLKAWDIKNSCNYYKSLKGTISATGKTFYILLDCGNFTTVGRYVPPAPKPEPPTYIGASCGIAGPIYISHDAKYATIPVSVYLAKGKKIKAGSQNSGLHFGVTYVGANKTWNVDDKKSLVGAPPDKQTNFVPSSSGNSGASYYSFKWDVDKATYRRYYNTAAKSSNFSVKLRVSVKDLNKRIAIRLLDRENGKWLAHSSKCEAEIKRKAAPKKCETNDSILASDPKCKEKCRYDNKILENDKNCVPCEFNSNIGKTNSKCVECKHKSGISADDADCVPDPILEIRKTIVDKKSSYKPGDELTYKIEYRNRVNASVAKNTIIKDVLNSGQVEIISVSPSSAKKGSSAIELNVGNLGYSSSFKTITVKTKIKSGVKSGDKVCNGSSINASNAPVQTSKICASVVVPCQYDPSLPSDQDKNCTKPVVACSVSNTNLKDKVATFTTIATSSNPKNTQIISYSYDFDDGSKETRYSNQLKDVIDHKYADGKYTIAATVNYTATGVSGTQSADCEDEISLDAPISKEKSVINLTKKLNEKDTLQNKVRSNDILEYSLITGNSLNYARKNVVVKDYVGDILEYSDLDLEYLKSQGGVYDEKNQTVIWKGVSIAANSSIEHKFKVKVKSKIPATNRPSSVGTAYDCEISNEYGDEVSLKVACPAVKNIESVSKTLPKTGPSASMMAGMGFTLVIGYFYSRARLMKKELAIVKNDFIATGGA